MEPCGQVESGSWTIAANGVWKIEESSAVPFVHPRILDEVFPDEEARIEDFFNPEAEPGVRIGTSESHEESPAAGPPSIKLDPVSMPQVSQASFVPERPHTPPVRHDSHYSFHHPSIPTQAPAPGSEWVTPSPAAQYPYYVETAGPCDYPVASHPNRANRVSTGASDEVLQTMFGHPSPAAEQRSKRGRPRATPNFLQLHNGVGFFTEDSYSDRSPPKSRRLLEGAKQSSKAAPCYARSAHESDSPSSCTSSETCIMLPTCKFISKRSGKICSAELSRSQHKRGHFSVLCSAGHQWVWCSACCNCHKQDGAGMPPRGCTNLVHWFERDAFDTGRRNHMNRHSEKPST